MDRDAFWAMYLREHAHPVNRALHAVGSLAALGCIVLAVVLWTWWPLVVAPVIGYGAAWTGHFLVERNRPATFRYPFRSFVADWRMLALVLSGRAGRAVARTTAEASQDTQGKARRADAAADLG